MLCPLHDHSKCNMKRKPFFMPGLAPNYTYLCLKKTRILNSSCIDSNLTAINKIHIMTNLQEGSSIIFKQSINICNGSFITNLANVNVQLDLTMSNNILYFDIVLEFPEVQINVTYNERSYKLTTRDDFDISHIYNNNSFVMLKKTLFTIIKCEGNNIFQGLHNLISELNPDIILTYQSHDKITLLSENTLTLIHSRYDIKVTPLSQTPFPLFFYLDLYTYLLQYNNNKKVINYDINQILKSYSCNDRFDTKFKKCMSLLTFLDVINFCYSLVFTFKIGVNDVCANISTRLNVLISHIAFNTKSYIFSDTDFDLVSENNYDKKSVYDMTKLKASRVECHRILSNSVPIFSDVTHEIVKEGGCVLDPLLGLHQNLGIVIDFDKLYATTISELGICLSNLYCTKDNQFYIQFNPNAPLPLALKNLIILRNTILRELSTTTCSVKKKELNNKQLSIKLLSNSLFGYIYLKFPPLGVLIVKEAKKQFFRAKTFCESMNCKVYYGDTDSLFLKIPKLKNVSEVIEFSDELVQTLNCQINPFSVKLECFVARSFFFSKKRYCLLTFDKDLHYSVTVSGLFNKREWPLFLRRTTCGFLANLMVNHTFKCAIHKFTKELMDFYNKFDNKDLYEICFYRGVTGSNNSESLYLFNVLKQNNCDLPVTGDTIPFIVLDYQSSNEEFVSMPVNMYVPGKHRISYTKHIKLLVSFFNQFIKIYKTDINTLQNNLNTITNLYMSRQLHRKCAIIIGSDNTLKVTNTLHVNAVQNIKYKCKCKIICKDYILSI